MSLLALRTVKELESMTVRQKCALWVFPTKKKRKGEPSPGQKICVMLPGNVPESKRAPPPPDFKSNEVMSKDRGYHDGFPASQR